MKTINKIVTAEQFLRKCNKFECPKPTLGMIKRLEDGAVLAKIVNKEKSTITIYILTKTYFRKFRMRYSCNKKVKKGDEMFISDMYLPPVNNLK